MAIKHKITHDRILQLYYNDVVEKLYYNLFVNTALDGRHMRLLKEEKYKILIEITKEQNIELIRATSITQKYFDLYNIIPNWEAADSMNTKTRTVTYEPKLEWNK